MRILQVVHSLPFLNQAGTEVYTQELAMQLARENEVYVFTRICDPWQEEYEIRMRHIGGLTVYTINNTFKYSDSFEGFYENSKIDDKFAQLLDEIRPEVVHIQHLVFLSIGIIREIKEKGLPIVFTLHDYWLMCPKWHLLKKDSSNCEKAFCDPLDSECVDCLSELIFVSKNAKKIYALGKKLASDYLLRRLKKIYFSYVKNTSTVDKGILKLEERRARIKDALEKVDVFLAPSQYLRQRFIAFGIPAEKIELSLYGRDLRLKEKAEKINAESLRFAFIGTIVPAKGLHVLVRAFSRIRKGGVELKIYGKIYPYHGFEYYPRYLRSIAKKSNISFMGECEHGNLESIFRETDVLIVPSIWQENAPLVIQEAILTKTTVIASRIGGIPELIQDGVNGLLAQAGDEEDLFKKIAQIAENPDCLCGFRFSETKIKSIEENALELEEGYFKLIEKKDGLSNYYRP